MAAVCVYCSASEGIAPEYLDIAARVGAELAARGHVLVSGGGSVSMMGALARAVREAGGQTLGVIPEALLAAEVADHDAHELVVTPDMRSRKGLMDARSDAFLALPGGLGTLEELLEVWVARTLGMHRKPVVILDPLGLFRSLRHLVDDLVMEGFVRPESRDAVLWTTSIQEAMDGLEAALGRRDGAPATGGATARPVAASDVAAVRHGGRVTDYLESEVEPSYGDG